jgi:hypothetical protein
VGLVGGYRYARRNDPIRAAQDLLRQFAGQPVIAHLEKITVGQTAPHLWRGVLSCSAGGYSVQDNGVSIRFHRADVAGLSVALVATPTLTIALHPIHPDQEGDDD